MDPLELKELLDKWLVPVDKWLDHSALRQSTRAEYRREIMSWLTWCATQRPLPVNPYRVGPEHVARWCEEEFLRPYLGERAFDGPEALEVIAAEHPEVARSHDRRITALVQYYTAASAAELVLQPPHLYDLRSGVERLTPPSRLDPRERALLLTAIGSWGPQHSPAPERDRLLAYLLLNGMRPAQAVRLEERMMTEQPDMSYVVRYPDEVDGPGRKMELDVMVGAAVKMYLPVRPEPKPGVHALLLSRLRGPLNSRFPNKLIRAMADTHPLLAQRYPPVTADTVAHTGLWDEAPGAAGQS